VEQAARILRAARKTGEPQDHADVLYAEVSKAAETILSKHPANLYTVPEREAMVEIIAACILMSNEASKLPPSWIAKLWREFCGKSPMAQIGIVLGLVTFTVALSAGASAAWYATPPALRWIADRIGEPPKTEETEVTPASSEASEDGPSK
jgi:hypothetical protein